MALLKYRSGQSRQLAETYDINNAIWKWREVVSEVRLCAWPSCQQLPMLRRKLSLLSSGWCTDAHLYSDELVTTQKAERNHSPEGHSPQCAMSELEMFHFYKYSQNGGIWNWMNSGFERTDRQQTACCSENVEKHVKWTTSATAQAAAWSTVDIVSWPTSCVCASLSCRNTRTVEPVLIKLYTCGPSSSSRRASRSYKQHQTLAWEQNIEWQWRANTYSSYGTCTFANYFKRHVP
jgi:hypothetical protein